MCQRCYTTGAVVLMSGFVAKPVWGGLAQGGDLEELLWDPGPSGWTACLWEASGCPQFQALVQCLAQLLSGGGLRGMVVLLHFCLHHYYLCKR